MGGARLLLHTLGASRGLPPLKALSPRLSVCGIPHNDRLPQNLSGLPVLMYLRAYLNAYVYAPRHRRLRVLRPDELAPLQPEDPGAYGAAPAWRSREDWTAF